MRCFNIVCYLATLHKTLVGYKIGFFLKKVIWSRVPYHVNNIFHPRRISRTAIIPLELFMRLIRLFAPVLGTNGTATMIYHDEHYRSMILRFHGFHTGLGSFL